MIRKKKRKEAIRATIFHGEHNHFVSSPRSPPITVLDSFHYHVECSHSETDFNFEN